MSETHRTFIAVPLDPHLAEVVAAVEQRLESAGARLRWVKPNNLHFTLRFLGHISAAQLVRVRTAVREAAAGFPAFTIRLQGVGAFPSERRPQVIWIGVAQGQERFGDLAAALDDRLARQRFPKEPRRFEAHLTLARVKEPGLWGSLGPLLAPLRAVDVGEQVVRSLIVMESQLRPSGALYTPVEEVPLLPYEK